MGHKRPNSARRRHVKAQLAMRDGARCFFCDIPFAPNLAGATIDHLIPFHRFPRNLQENLVLACQPCNVAKDGRSPEKFLQVSVEALAERCNRDAATVLGVLLRPTEATVSTRRRVLKTLRHLAAEPRRLAVAA